MSSKWAKGTAGPAGDEHHNLIPVPFDTTQITSPDNYSMPAAGDPCHPMAAGAHAPCIAFPERLSGTQCANSENVSPSLGALNPTAVAFDMRGRDGGAMLEGPHETANIRAASGGSSRSYVATQWAVRRLTPLECERLQGFPDGHTNVIHKGKEPADGPRYKAMGNSWAVNCARWIGERIEAVDAIVTQTGPEKSQQPAQALAYCNPTAAELADKM